MAARSIQFSYVAILALFLSACASSPDSAIDQEPTNRIANPTVSERETSKDSAKVKPVAPEMDAATVEQSQKAVYHFSFAVYSHKGRPQQNLHVSQKCGCKRLAS